MSTDQSGQRIGGVPILRHDTEFRDMLAEFYLRKIYKRLRQES
jgi:hypothetical protein